MKIHHAFDNKNSIALLYSLKYRNYVSNLKYFLSSNEGTIIYTKQGKKTQVLSHVIHVYITNNVTKLTMTMRQNED